MGKRRRQPSARYRQGYVIVHGIGPTRPGGTLDTVTEATRALLDKRFGPDAVKWTERNLGAAASAGVLQLGNETRTAPGEGILFAEARWTGLSGLEPRISGQAAWWALKNLVLMIPFIALPNLKDIERTVSRQQHIFPDFDAVTPVLRMAWRIMLILSAALLVVAGLRLLFSWNPLAALCIVAATAGLSIVGTLLIPTDFAGQVRIAASSSATRKRIIDHISEVISLVEAECQTVTVIAHSQGGYLVHQVLQHPGRHPRVRSFWGVGSGLRPISVLFAMQNKRLSLGTFIILLGAVGNFIGALMLLGPGGIISGLFDVKVVNVLAASVAIPQASILFAQNLGGVADVFESVVIGLRNSVVPLVVQGASVGIILLGDKIRRGTTAPLEQLSAINKRIRWREYATPHDVVGRDSVPPLPPQAQQVMVPGSNPLLDHLLKTYFKRGSYLCGLLATEVSEGLTGNQLAHTRREIDVLRVREIRRTGKWYALRGLSQGAILAWFILLPSVLFGQGILRGLFLASLPALCTAFLIASITVAVDRLLAKRRWRAQLAIIGSRQHSDNPILAAPRGSGQRAVMSMLLGVATAIFLIRGLVLTTPFSFFGASLAGTFFLALLLTLFAVIYGAGFRPSAVFTWAPAIVITIVLLIGYLQSSKQWLGGWALGPGVIASGVILATEVYAALSLRDRRT